MSLPVLDLFSAAAGGWSLGMHRAGFTTIAACEAVEWRRILYAENNPNVPIYEDVRDLTAARLVRDIGRLPAIIVGSPPCQDISSANTKGRGVEGERSGLYFEAIRLVSECRPRWFAFENSANLRTRGADRVLDAVEGIGYACEPVVVGAGDGPLAAGVGANHPRARSWLIGFDPGQVVAGAFCGVLGGQGAEHAGSRARHAEGDGWGQGWPRRHALAAPGLSEPTCGDASNPDGVGRDAGRQGRRVGLDLPVSDDPEHAASLRRKGRRSRRHGPDGDGEASASRGDVTNAALIGCQSRTGDVQGSGREGDGRQSQDRAARSCNGSHPDHEGQPDGAEHAEVGGSPGAGGDVAEPWADWNFGLAGHLRLDDGLSAWVAQSRIAVGGPRGTAAASLLVEAFGDAVLPQIPEAIGRAILRTEAALAAIYGRAAA